MSLRDAGLRFYASPDGSDARWMHPLLKDGHYPDWVDLTDMTDDEVVAFHESVRADDEQLDLL